MCSALIASCPHSDGARTGSDGNHSIPTAAGTIDTTHALSVVADLAAASQAAFTHLRDTDHSVASSTDASNTGNGAHPAPPVPLPGAVVSAIAGARVAIEQLLQVSAHFSSPPMQVSVGSSLPASADAHADPVFGAGAPASKLLLRVEALVRLLIPASATHNRST